MRDMATLGARALKPMEHTGDSANIAYYRERGARPDQPYIWCEILRSGVEKVDGGEWRRKIRPDYYVTVHRQGDRYGEPLAEFTYTPARPAADVLPTRTVARLIREALARAS